jgi:FkbM family methyltransferase
LRVLDRVTQLAARRRRARRLGFEFPRARDFRLPQTLKIGGRSRVLSLPENDGVRSAFIPIFLDDCYGLERTSGVRSVLDIGANVGVFGVAARIAYPEAVIHAYEPNSELEPHLRKQAEAADFKYFLEAVGLEGGRVTLDRDPDPVLTRSRLAPDGQVPQVAFREALQRLGGGADLVKVDCEGAEWSFLGDRDAWKEVRHLSMEYHLWPSHSVPELMEAVRGLGFSVTRHQPVEADYGLLLASRG